MVAIFEEAEALSHMSNVWVFLDEVNTSNEIGLLSEAIVAGMCSHPTSPLLGYCCVSHPCMARH